MLERVDSRYEVFAFRSDLVHWEECHQVRDVAVSAFAYAVGRILPFAEEYVASLNTIARIAPFSVVNFSVESLVGLLKVSVELIYVFG